MSGGTQTGWQLTLASGTQEDYDMGGYLVKVTLQNGLSHSFTYDTTAPGLGMTITNDDTGTSLTATYLNGNIESIEYAFNGSTATVDYVWDITGRLKHIAYPGGFVQVYEYNDTNHTDYITSIFELSPTEYSAGTPYPESRRYSKVTYDSLGRVTSSALWDGTQKTEELTFAYDWTWSSATTSPKTTVTNAGGVSTEYAFTTSAALNTNNSVNDWKLVSVDGEADSATGCAATSAATTYDNGYIETTTDKSGSVLTKRTRDGQGRITTLQTGLNSSESPTTASQKIVTTYSGSTSLPASKTYYGYSASSWAAYRSEAFTYGTNNRLSARSETDLINSVTRNWGYSTTYHSGTAVPSVVIVTDPRSNASTYNYNSSGQLTSVVNALSQTTSYSDFNEFGQPETVTDPNGTVTTLTYDVRGRLTGSSTASAATSIEYQPNGLVQKITSPDGSWLEYTYNSAHQLTGVENQLGETITLTPSLLNGQWTSMQLADGSSAVVLQQSRVLDALGRVWKQRDAAANDKTVFNYDANDNLRAVIALGDSGTTLTYDDVSRVTTRSFDGQNRLTSESRCTDSTPPTPPYSCGSPLATTAYTYDDQGNIKTVTDAEGHVTTYTYNGFGELATQVSPDTGTTKYTYDDAGNLATKTKGFGTADVQVISYSWDALNRLTAINYPGSDQDVAYTYDQGTNGKGHLTQVVDASGQTDYEYTALGKVTRKTETLPGATSSPTDDIVQITDYVYGTDGVLEQTVYPDGLEIEAAHDDGQLTGLSDATASQTLLSDITHQPFGGITGWHTNTTALAGQYLREFDQNGRLALWGIAEEGEEPVTTSLDYDAYGNISAVNSYDPGKSEAYEYDGLSRLSQVTAAYGRIAYSYDAVGNRTETVYERQDPTTHAWQEFYTEAYDLDSASNRLEGIARTQGVTALRTRTFAYDARGNIKTDTRQKTGETAVVHDLHYGNSDRLNSLDKQ